MNPADANVKNNAAAPAPVAPSAAPAASDNRGERPRGNSRGGSGGRGGPRKGGDRAPRTKPEYDSVMLNIRRVSRTVSGGRRFSFSVALVAGNRKGLVGVGLGKAGDTALAIDKATRNAKKHMIKINATKDNSIPHEVFAKYASARVSIRPVKACGWFRNSNRT
jgi:small subunit ribosomal protein S5